MRKEGETTIIEEDLETRTLRFESTYSKFEQRVIDYNFEDKVYKGIIRFSGSDDRILGSLYFPDIQVSPGSGPFENLGVHKEILERALIVCDKKDIDKLLNRNVICASSRWGNDDITSKSKDCSFLPRRMEIDEVYEIAEAVLRYEHTQESSSHNYGTLYGLGILGVVASVPFFVLASSTAGIISSGLGCLVLAGLSIAMKYQKQNLIDRWEHGEVTYENLEIIQAIEEEEIKKETRDKGFDRFFSGISWAHSEYRQGLNFRFDGPREIVEEKINALLGHSSLRRIKYPDEIKFEQKQLQKQIKENMVDARMGKTCMYCRDDFVLGDAKIYGEIYIQNGDQYIAVKGDLHPGCNDDVKEAKESRKPIRRIKS